MDQVPQHTHGPPPSPTPKENGSAADTQMRVHLRNKAVLWRSAGYAIGDFEALIETDPLGALARAADIEQKIVRLGTVAEDLT